MLLNTGYGSITGVDIQRDNLANAISITNNNMHALINYMYLYKDLAIRFLCMSAIDEPHDTLNQAIENKIKET